MNEPRIWPNSPEEEHRLRQDIAARATQDSSEPDAAKELVKAIRRARHDGVKLVAAHDAALIAKTLAERQAAESPGPDDLVCCARCNEMKECLWIETGFAGEHEPLCASCISAERSLAEVSPAMREMTAEECADMKQFTKAQYKTAEVSADEIVEAVLIAVANIPINPALRGDLVYVKDVYAAIRALKGTFSLRASGTPLIERLVTALGSAARR